MSVLAKIPSNGSAGVSRSFRRALSIAAGLVPLSASAHVDLAETIPKNWHDLARAWTFEPGVIIPLVLLVACYLRGMSRLRRKSPTLHRSLWLKAGCFLAGCATLVIALISPLHAWGSALFSVHMVQHELLMLIAAPLLVVGKPIAGILWGLPRPWSMWIVRAYHASAFSTLYRVSSNIVVAWLIHAVVLWLWHLPSAFEAALESNAVHAAQHASFLASALLFWHSLIHGQHRASAYGTGVLYLFTTAMHTGLLGALLSLSPSPWYEAYELRAPLWGLTALEDQQLGGLIMWIPAGVVYIGSALVLFAAWLRESERRAIEREAARFQTAESAMP